MMGAGVEPDYSATLPMEHPCAGAVIAGAVNAEAVNAEAELPKLNCRSCTLAPELSMPKPKLPKDTT